MRVVDAVYSNLRGDQPEKLRITYEHLRDAQPADRLLLAVRVRHDRAAARRAGLRLRAAGADGLDEPDRRAGRAAGEVRAVAGGLQRRLRARARAAGRRLARAPRRRRLRLRHLAVRDRALAADLRRARGPRRAGTSTERRAESAHPSIVPFQAFRTADGWITVAAAKQKFWLGLCAALAPELADDPRFADFEERAEHREELLALLRPLLRAPADGRR